MPNFFLSFNILPTDSQLKGRSNLPPQVPVESKWWTKNSSKPSLPPPAKPTRNPALASAPRTPATASSSRTTRELRNIQSSPSPGYANSKVPPSTRSRSGGSSWKGSTKNLLLIEPICRSCTEVVNSITEPLKRRPTRRASSRTSTGPNGRISDSKATWDGLPSTYYLRLSPEPDYQKLREMKFRPERRTHLPHSNNNNSLFGKQNLKPEKQKRKKSSWKFWLSIL